MSGLDGYLTALIIGPKFINPYQWIPLFAGEGAMALPMETTEHQAVQTIVAEYNRISATLQSHHLFPRQLRLAHRLPPRNGIRPQAMEPGHPWPCCDR
ncbi:yecA family protein [Rhizobium ruizarguesonis]